MPQLPREVADGAWSLATNHDRARAAAHEAGHALVCAAVRDDLLEQSAQVQRRAFNGSLGNCAFRLDLPQGLLQDRRLVEWRMLLALAGMSAEMALHGTAALGAADDNRTWLERARLYLANFERGVFYDPPGSDLEAVRNERRLEALRDEQCALLTRFFSMNLGVLRDLAAVLFERGRLDRGALMPFLERVELPIDFPTPDQAEAEEI